MHNLISYIGTTDDHLTSSTALHSDSPTTSTATSSKTDQTAKQEEDGSESNQEASEAAGREEEGGEREGGSEEEKEGEGEEEILEYEPSPEVLKVEVEKWRSSLNYAIDSQDTQTTEKVYQYCCLCVLILYINCQDCMRVKSKFGSSVIY